MAEVDPGLMSVANTQIDTDVRCSIILLAGDDRSKLNTYLLYLSEAKFPINYELVIVCTRKLQIDERLLRGFLPGLRILNVNSASSQEQSFDIAAKAAKGTFMLFVRTFVKFDKLILREAIEELESSGEKISISANSNFVLTEKDWYECAGGFERLVRDIGSGREVAEPECPDKISHFKNLRNEIIPFKCGRGTFIDPDVVIDSPDLIRIGENCTIRKGVVLRPEGGGIVIGNNCVINHYCVLHGKGGIYLGDWTIVAPHCGIYSQNHSYERFDIPITKQKSTGKGIYLMGDNWIGSHTVICDDVTLGKGAVVGANSTVTKSIPMASVSVGCPAKVIKNRHLGDWDFRKRERASSKQMPQDICEHVRNRGMLLEELVSVEDRVLDVGCGEGIITAILAEKNQDIIGCDYSIEAVKAAAKQYPQIEFAYSNSTNLRFGNESFTKIIMSDVAEHLMPVQFIKTLAEIDRVLQAEGSLILATPLSGNARNTSTYAHIYEYSEEEMNQILSRTFCEVRLVNKPFGIFTARKR